MATGKKQNGRCPFPKKAKFRAIQHWLPTPNCYRHYWVFEHWACWDFLLSSKSIRVGGEKGPGALATDIRSWQWWHRQSGGFAATLHWRKLSLVLVLVNFGNCSAVSVVHHGWPPCPWVSVSLHRCPWLLMGVHWCLWEPIAWQRAGPWSNQCPSLLPTPLDHALPPAVTVRRIRCDHLCKIQKLTQEVEWDMRSCWMRRPGGVVLLVVGAVLSLTHPLLPSSHSPICINVHNFTQHFMEGFLLAGPITFHPKLDSK